MPLKHSSLARRKASIRRQAPALSDDVDEAYPPHPGRRMTEEEFLSWMKGLTRAEWVDGEVIVMAPISADHAEMNGWLRSLLCSFVETKDLGRVCGCRYMIRIAKPPARRQPDIFFVSKSRYGGFGEYAFEGPPDAIFEIVSPDSAARDYRDNLQSYEASGVKEYWIIDPLVKRVEANELVRGRYRSVDLRQDAIHSKAIKGFFLRPKWCWQTPLPRVAEVLRELGVK